MHATIQFHSRIPVRNAGYQWGRAGRLTYADSGEPVDSDKEDDEELFSSYDPFVKEPGLFLAFAEIRSGPAAAGLKGQTRCKRFSDAVLDFVNRYGTPTFSGNFLAAIEAEVDQMAAAVALWNAARAEDAEEMGRYIGWSERGGWKCKTKSLQSLIAQKAPEGWSKLPRTKKDVFQRAAEIVSMIVAAKCEGPLQMQPTRPGDGTLELCLRIDDLLDVLWLQFALAVANDKQYRRCLICSRSFEIAPGRNRKDRRFCSDACRVRSFRHRHALAQLF